MRHLHGSFAFGDLVGLLVCRHPGVHIPDARHVRVPFREDWEKTLETTKNKTTSLRFRKTNMNDTSTAVDIETSAKKPSMRATCERLLSRWLWVVHVTDDPIEEVVRLGFTPTEAENPTRIHSPAAWTTQKTK